MTNLTLWILVALFIAVFVIPVPARSASAPDRTTDPVVRRTTLAARSALGWVVVFFAFHVYWYCGGHFASPGELPPLSTPNRVEGAAGLHSVVSWVLNAVIELAWPVGALVCLTIARGRASGRIAWVTQALAWVGCVLLLLRGVSGLVDDATRATGLLPNGITGLSLKETTGHAHLHWSGWVIDGYFLVGGIAFWFLAFRRPRRRSRARDRDVDEAAVHRSKLDPAAEPLAQRPVPRWARCLAHSIPLMVLPSGLWRLSVAFGFSMGMANGSGHVSVERGWPAVYIAVISLLSEVVALTAFGLVRPLGEEVPRWLPLCGGHPVRPNVVIGAATVGSVALILIWTVGFWNVWTGGSPGPMVSSFWATVFTACYAPLNLWGPALLTLTWAYHRRRVTRTHSSSSQGKSP